jgi:hypothetical protein
MLSGDLLEGITEWMVASLETEERLGPEGTQFLRRNWDTAIKIKHNYDFAAFLATKKHLDIARVCEVLEKTEDTIKQAGHWGEQ